MTFDASIAAQHALQRVQALGELGQDIDHVMEAEAVFSAGVGDEAGAAFEQLQSMGRRYAHAKFFQAFLIYITWQQFVEETCAKHADTGLSLTERYLAAWNDEDADAHHIRELRISFQAALGLQDVEENDYDEDVFKGGD